MTAKRIKDCDLRAAPTEETRLSCACQDAAFPFALVFFAFEY